MTAEQLCEEIKAAREGDPIPNFPSKFFNNGVYVKQPNGTTIPRHPRYCATANGAARLANVLYAQRGFECVPVLKQAMGWPKLESWGFEDSEPVPFLRFVKLGDELIPPVDLNAGLLLDAYFNHNFPPVSALNLTHADVLRSLMVAAGKPEDEIASAVAAVMARTA